MRSSFSSQRKISLEWVEMSAHSAVSCLLADNQSMYQILLLRFTCTVSTNVHTHEACNINNSKISTYELALFWPRLHLLCALELEVKKTDSRKL